MGSVKSYKGFDKALKCRGMQFTVGEEVSVEGPIKPCENGLHACEEPLRVFDYYPPATSRYCAVTQSGDMERTDGKIASRTLRVDAEIGIPGLVKAHIEYVKAHTTTEHTDPERATAGDGGAATAGDGGAATAGYCGAATAGNRGAATSRGTSAVGENGIACARGNGCKVKGGLGAILVIAEEARDSYKVAHWQAFVVDGENIKPDTWYKLKDGNLEEVTEE